MAEALDLIVVSLLLRIVANDLDGILGGHDGAGVLGGDFKFAVTGCDGADNGLAVFEGEMQSLRRHDGGDSVPLDVDVAGEIGLDQKSFCIGLDDGSGQPVAVFQSYLIGPRTDRADGKTNTNKSI